MVLISKIWWGFRISALLVIAKSHLCRFWFLTLWSDLQDRRSFLCPVSGKAYSASVARSLKRVETWPDYNYFTPARLACDCLKCRRPHHASTAGCLLENHSGPTLQTKWLSLAFCSTSGIYLCLRSKQDALKLLPPGMCRKCLINSCGENGFVVFASFHGVNTPTLTDFKLLRKRHWRKRWKQMCTAHARQLQHPVVSKPIGFRKIETLPIHTSPLWSNSPRQLSNRPPKWGTSFPLPRSSRPSHDMGFS